MSRRTTYKVGDYVVLEKIGHEGVIEYVGDTEFAEGTWYGLELWKGHGKNDGTVQDVWYFDCEQGKGLFVREARIKYSMPDPRKKAGRTRTKVKHSPVPSLGSSPHDLYAPTVTTHVKRKKKKRKVSRKLGPGDYAKSDYNPEPFKDVPVHDDFLSPKVSSRTRKSLKAETLGIVPRKAGSIETGRREYDGIKYKAERKDEELYGYKSSRAKPRSARIMDGTAQKPKKKKKKGSAATTPSSATPDESGSTLDGDLADDGFPQVGDAKADESSEVIAGDVLEDDFEDEVEYEEVYEEVEVEIRYDSDGNEYEVEIPVAEDSGTGVVAAAEDGVDAGDVGDDVRDDAGDDAADKAEADNSDDFV